MQRNDYGTTTGSASSSQITITARSLLNLSEARAEIERLEKEVARLTDELTTSCARAELQQRESERLRRDNGVLHDAIEKIFEEGAKQLARADTAWNDAIEAAAEEASEWWAYLHDDQDRDGPVAATIRALKRS